MKKLLGGLALMALAGVANAQTATFSIVLNPPAPGPVANGTMITGSVRVTWTRGTTSASGLAGGQFRIRFTDSGNNFGISGVTNPNGGSGGINGETTAQRVGVPLAEVLVAYPGDTNLGTNPGGTVSDSWTSGRRPKRAYLQDSGDPTSLQSGGGFRFPPNGSGNTDVHYVVEGVAGNVILSGRNGMGVENRIEYAQTPRGLQADPLFYESQTTFDLFKFKITMPATGSGTITAMPEVAVASLFSSDQGAQVTPAVSTTSATVTYTPAPSTLALLGLGGLIVGRRRR